MMSSPSRVALLHVVHITTDSDIAESGVGRQARLTTLLPPTETEQPRWRHSSSSSDDDVDDSPSQSHTAPRLSDIDPSRFAKYQRTHKTNKDMFTKSRSGAASLSESAVRS